MTAEVAAEAFVWCAELAQPMPAWTGLAAVPVPLGFYCAHRAHGVRLCSYQNRITRSEAMVLVPLSSVVLKAVGAAVVVTPLAAP